MKEGKPQMQPSTNKGTKRKWESLLESEVEELQEPEEDADEDEVEEDNSDESGTEPTPAKALKWSHVQYHDETTARRHQGLRVGFVSLDDELVAEVEWKKTIYWFPDDADSKNWNLEGQYLSAHIAFCTAKEAEQYCKRMPLALKKKKAKEQQHKERESCYGT